MAKWAQLLWVDVRAPQGSSSAVLIANASPDSPQGMTLTLFGCMVH